MEVMMLDGGMGTELARRGMDVSDSLWSARILLEQPNAIEQVHCDYLESGAECITTASYQVSFKGFARAGYSNEAAAKALTASVAVAKRARARMTTTEEKRKRLKVAASVGPYGASLADGSEYHGSYDCNEAELFAFHHPRIQWLSLAEPDLLACETIPSLKEAEVLLRVLRQFPAQAAWFAFACRDGHCTVHGDSIRECARILERERQVAAIGINCTAPEHAGSLVEEIRSVTEKPIVAYPNSGQRWDAVNRCWVGEVSEADWGRRAVEWHERGARWIGGCCGTRPGDIREMRRGLVESGAIP